MMSLDKSQIVVWPLSDGAMVAQILWLGLKDVFTQIAKDVVLERNSHDVWEPKFSSSISVIERKSRNPNFPRGPGFSAKANNK
ncbi:hypothetical protein DY000_02039896 [Brassica cretica]|uniref:Uncharacterized protein n=1 Tax=Brassica cretica TaxID=69181 RepID=A0ABQ7BGX5_BRACR|nr:hypothetical protein DY000_02039896 [Brassica cretica]